MLNITDDRNDMLDAAVRQLEHAERVIRQMRAKQLELLARLDRSQVAVGCGARSLKDWVAATLDMDPRGARDLVSASRLADEHPDKLQRLASGDVGFDRTYSELRLAALRVPPAVVEASSGRDIAGLRRLIGRHRRTSIRAERKAFFEQYVVVQPSLDRCTWRLVGQLAGVSGSIVDEALTARSDALPHPVGIETRPHRNAHALVSIAQDSLNGPSGPESGGSGPTVTVFVDAAAADGTGGESGAELAAGPPVGPATLERLLCEGSTRVVAVDGLRPVAASRNGRTIPPAMRQFVTWRDGGCVVDGCSSRYRLQPHHIVHWSRGGTHDADNLATLCWYHHHVAIHGSGFRLDPDSPPQRRRLIPPPAGPDPPGG